MGIGTPSNKSKMERPIVRSSFFDDKRNGKGLLRDSLATLGSGAPAFCGLARCATSLFDCTLLLGRIDPARAAWFRARHQECPHAVS